MWQSHSDINPTNFRYTFGSIYLSIRYVPLARDNKDLYHIEFSNAEYIEFYKIKYI